MSGGRGGVGAGRRSALPDGAYAPPAPVDADGGLVVAFSGEDGRRRRLDVGRLPLPGWHGPLAAALSRRLGPVGELRTATSAVVSCWGPLRRLMRYLAALPDAPAVPDAVTVVHMEGFLHHRAAAIGDGYAAREVRVVGMLLQTPPLDGLVRREVVEFTRRRAPRCGTPRPGYSDGELSRLIGAARRDAAAIRDRIDAGEALLAGFHTDPGTLAAAERADAALMADAADGCLPARGLGRPDARLRVAQRLFVTRPDLVPLLVLLVALTGWNVETVKELPAEHRILDARAVELQVVKRRRGARRWVQTVTWEIGTPHRQLHTPGGIYLLVHRLTARSRELSGTSRLWAVWRNGYSAGVSGRDEHHDPFGEDLEAQLSTRRWTAGHGLLADAVDNGDAGDGAEPQRLVLDFNRLKTSVDVRRTRQMGGHLPSTARSNTIPVLFRHYLRGDATVLAWAGEVVAEAVADAEQAALAAHRRTVQTAGGGPRIVAGPATPQRLREHGLDADSADRAGRGELDTAWSACLDPDEHPATGGRCEVSFLDCFHCGNCLVTSAHLPRLLALLDALTVRRGQLAEADWWTRYGPTWAAIRHDVLIRFSPQEVAEAARHKPSDALLDLVENPWEHP